MPLVLTHRLPAPAPLFLHFSDVVCAAGRTKYYLARHEVLDKQ